MPTKAHAAALVVGILESAIVQYFVLSVDRERFNGDKEARAASQPCCGSPVYTNYCADTTKLCFTFAKPPYQQGL